jgi:DNA-binding NtrC family response regulator
MGGGVQQSNIMPASAAEDWSSDSTDPRGDSAGGTVLVVEDDDDTRGAISELLQEQGYRVVPARHGREAQVYLRDGGRADCMVLDLWMPEMDGWTLAAEMRQGRLPQVPMIVMTAAEPHWGYPAPIVIRKPLDALRLVTMVRAMVPPPPHAA